MILYQDPEEETEEIPSDKMLKLPSSCGLPEVFNLLQELFDRYDAWDEKLNTLTRQDSNIQELLDASFPIFGNPLLLRAADFFSAGLFQHDRRGPEALPSDRPGNFL